MNDYLGNLTTESVNERTKHIDECSTTEILMLINEEDSLVPGAVKETIPKIHHILHCYIIRIQIRTCS